MGWSRRIVDRHCDNNNNNSSSAATSSACQIRCPCKATRLFFEFVVDATTNNFRLFSILRFNFIFVCALGPPKLQDFPELGAAAPEPYVCRCCFGYNALLLLLLFFQWAKEEESRLRSTATIDIVVVVIIIDIVFVEICTKHIVVVVGWRKVSTADVTWRRWSSMELKNNQNSNRETFASCMHSFCFCFVFSKQEII